MSTPRSERIMKKLIKGAIVMFLVVTVVPWLYGQLTEAYKNSPKKRK